MYLRYSLVGLLALLTAACAQLPTTGPDATPAPGAARVTATDTVAGTLPEALVTIQTAQAPDATPSAPAAAVEAPPANLWQRVRAGFRLSDMNGPLVREWEQWYSSRPDYVARMVERSSRFLYHVVEEVERRKMPAEIALLPMIESAYNPQAYSRSHASGIWQFIPSTGKLYGLRQNFWYDGRRDVLAATNAALDYLEKLHGMFGSWELALAAYNWGEGAVSRAIVKNQARGLPADYESLTLPPETRNYVPKLQAVKNIVANPAQYGLELADVPNQPYFATVTTRRHIDVKLAASFAEMPVEEFRFLNPAHNKPVIKSDGSETLVLPRHQVETFLRNLEAHDQPLVTWQTYTLKRNDQPEKIAAKHGITLAQLKEINGITGKKKIRAGQTLLVPLRGNFEPNLPDLPAPKVTPVRHASKGNYKQACTRSAAAKTAQRTTTIKCTTAKTTRQPPKRVNVTIRAQ